MYFNYIRPCAIMASIMITTIKTLSRLRAAALYAAGGRGAAAERRIEWIIKLQ